MTVEPVDTVETQPVPALREPDEAALRLAEAVVFASVTPMTPRALSQILPDDMDATAVIAALRARFAGRGIELAEIGGGLQFRTAPDLAPRLRKVVQVPRRLPRVALETLAIIAYHQPITRPEVEDLRGTGLSQQTLDVLLENDLIVARGRKETPGRPTLWGTTPRFLEYFGLRDIRELPRRQDLLLETVRPETETNSTADEPRESPAEPSDQEHGGVSESTEGREMTASPESGGESPDAGDTGAAAGDAADAPNAASGGETLDSVGTETDQNAAVTPSSQTNDVGAGRSGEGDISGVTDATGPGTDPVAEPAHTGTNGPARGVDP